MEDLKVCFTVFFFELVNKITEYHVLVRQLKCFCNFWALQRLMLKFSSMAPELERLNELGYRLPLNDSEIKRVQNLNRSWSTASAQTTERFR